MVWERAGREERAKSGVRKIEGESMKRAWRKGWGWRRKRVGERQEKPTSS